MTASARDRYLQRMYGISEAEYLKILKHQGGVCAICCRPPKPGKNLHVDHDHRTGVVRGLLCVTCNVDLLGRRDKEPNLFRRAAEYLELPPAPIALGREQAAPARPKRRRRKATSKSARVRVTATRSR